MDLVGIVAVAVVVVLFVVLLLGGGRGPFVARDDPDRTRDGRAVTPTGAVADFESDLRAPRDGGA